MSKAIFKDGDLVTICRLHSVIAIDIVRCVSPRKMTLNGGSQWTADGLSRWGTKNDCCFVMHRRKGDVTEAKRASLRLHR